MRAVVYARTSTLDQAREEKVSIPDQINWAKTFALEKGWEWLGEYIEPGVFGDIEPEKREAMNRMLEEARNDKFDLVLVYHSSRFAREPDIGMRACRILGQIKKQVYFRNSPIDPLSPDKFSWGINIGSMYMTAFSFIGDFQENVARSERVRSGFLGLAKRGKLVFAPYGYRKVPKMITDELGRQRYDWNFEINPSQARIIQKIYNKYLNEGGSIRQIMLSLNKDNIPSPSGKTGIEAWSSATVKNILSNPVYIKKVRWGRKLGGKYLQGKTSTGKQKRIIMPVEKWILKDGNQPRIIEDEAYFRVQEKLKLRYALKGRAIASKGLLTGLVICGRCKRKAYFKTTKIKKGSRVRSDYTCSSYFMYKSCQRHLMTSKKLHENLINEIDKIASNLKYRNSLLKQKGKDKNKQLKIQFELLKKEKKEIELKQQRILMAYESGQLPLEEFGNARRRLDTNAIEIIKKLEEVEKILNDTSKAKELRKKFIHTISNFRKVFHKAPFEKQKELLQSLINTVLINKNKITINYRI